MPGNRGAAYFGAAQDSRVSGLDSGHGEVHAACQSQSHVATAAVQLSQCRFTIQQCTSFSKSADPGNQCLQEPKTALVGTLWRRPISRSGANHRHAMHRKRKVVHEGR